MTQKEDRKMIAALLRERQGYERRGEKDRVKQVDEQLKYHGYKPESKETEPQGRTAPPAKTADASGSDKTAVKAAGAARARGTAAAKTDSGEAEPAKE
ncbi:hypothetical protein ACWFQ8_29790 [Streptomyces sp. NPDC055254]